MPGTFTHRHITYTIVSSFAPGDRQMPNLQAAIERGGFSHIVCARRPKGTKTHTFHARIENGEVVAVSTPY